MPNCPICGKEVQPTPLLSVLRYRSSTCLHWSNDFDRELIGTDGFVMPAAVEFSTWMAASPASTMKIEMKLLGDQATVLWPFIDAKLGQP